MSASVTLGLVVALVLVVAIAVCWSLPWLLAWSIVKRTNDTAGLRDVAKVLQASRGVFFFSLRSGSNSGSDSDPPGGGDQAT